MALKQLQTIVVFRDRVFQHGDPAIATIPQVPTFVGPEFLRDNPDFDCRYDVLGFEFEVLPDENTLWFHADTYGDPTHVAWLVHKFLKRFRPDQCWSLTYANTCSKPRVGEFSGGAVFITSTEITQQTADDFIQQQRAAFKQYQSVGT